MMKSDSTKCRCPGNQKLVEGMIALMNMEPSENRKKSYTKVIDSMLKYPLLIGSVIEAKELAGVGVWFTPKIAKVLNDIRDEEIAFTTSSASDFEAAHGISNKRKRDESSVKEPASAAPKARQTKKRTTDDNTKPKKPKEYTPRANTGSYAILIALELHELEPCKDRDYLSKSELQQLATPYATHSFYESDNLHYTAWSNMRDLIKKGLVRKWSNPPRFQITEEGRVVAQRCLLHHQQSSAPTGSKPAFGSPGPPSYNAQSSTKDNCASSNDSLNIDPFFSSSSSYRCSSTSTYSKTSDSPVSSKSHTPSRFRSSSSYAASTKSSATESFFSTSSSYSFSSTLGSFKSAISSSPKTTSNSPNVHSSNASTEPETTRSDSFSSIPPDYVHSSNADDWTIICIIDEREKGPNSDRSFMVNRLSQLGVLCERRVLAIGDMMWIARSKWYPTVEVVLNCIVERKRMSDLASSITEPRYKEQRSRLKRTGLSRIVYLVEGQFREIQTPSYLKSGSGSKPPPWMNNQSSRITHGIGQTELESAMCILNTVFGFFVQRTMSPEMSMKFLRNLSICVSNDCRYNGIPTPVDRAIGVVEKDASQDNAVLMDLVRNGLPDHKAEGETFAHFHHRMAKSGAESMKLLFGRQLRSIRGCSVRVAQAVINQYSTARTLWQAFRDVEPPDDPKLLIHRKCSPQQGKKIGPKISQDIFHFMTLRSYDDCPGN